MTLTRHTSILRSALATAALLACGSLFAQEAAIRKSLSERLPNFPKIDEISRTPVAGLFEVRYGGTEILYSDATGEYIFINGAMVEVKTPPALTEARVEKLLAIDFDKLPLKDAMVLTQGTGARKMAVFGDPNCPYCKRFERDIAGLKDVTIYSFLIPILGPDSTTKARDVWCAKDSGRAWRAWMIDGTTPPKAASGCDSTAVERNLEFARKHRINGTPAVVFEDGTRKPGALPVDAVEKLLVAAAKKP